MQAVIEARYRMGKLRVRSCPRCGSPAPALQVYGDLFRCTACGISGGPVQFLAASGMTVLEASRALGIQLVPPHRAAAVLSAARVEFERELWRSHERGRELLAARGIDRSTASRFHVGATPPQGALVRRLVRRGFTLEELAEAGIVRRRGGLYAEQLCSRLVFPLLDPAGRTVGFAGRSLDGSEPKYLNTPASPLGSRGDVLFGLPQAAPHIRERGEAWVVEGCFDVLACWQAGLRWVVAPCGTAVTVRQALLLRRYTERAILLYDPDAGAEAVERARARLLEAGIEVRVGRLPPGADPDERIRREGPVALIAAAEEAKRC